MGRVTLVAYPQKNLEEKNWPFTDQEENQILATRDRIDWTSLDEAWVAPGLRALYTVQMISSHVAHVCICIAHPEKNDEERYHRIHLAPKEKLVLVFVQEKILQTENDTGNFLSHVEASIKGNKHLLVVASRKCFNRWAQEMGLSHQEEEGVIVADWVDGRWFSSTTTSSG